MSLKADKSIVELLPLIIIANISFVNFSILSLRESDEVILINLIVSYFSSSKQKLYFEGLLIFSRNNSAFSKLLKEL